MKIVNSQKDLPKARHWAILRFSTIHIPGDERSRTNPGHGYPAEEKPVVVYEAYTDKKEWLRAIHVSEGDRRMGCTEHYVAIEVNPMTVTARVEVDVAESR